MANYVYSDLQVSKSRIDDEINNLGNGIADPKLLLEIDYVYHHQDNDYDGGLSFLDRINKKLGVFHGEWNIQHLKDTIRNAEDQQAEYLRVINWMFQDQRDITYYGL